MKNYLLEHSKGLLQSNFYTLVDHTTIGRNPENTIRLIDPKISRTHARIIFKNEKWILIDLKSRNGTYVNGSKILSHALKHGDLIRIGDNTLKFLEAEQPDRRISLEETRMDFLTDSPTQEIQDKMDLVKTFLEALPIGAAIINEKMEVRYCNPQMASFGFAHDDEKISLGVILGCRMIQSKGLACGFSPDCVRCPLHAAAYKVFKKGISTRDLEISWKTAENNKTIYVRFSLLPLPYILTGEPLAQLTWEDITLRTIAQDALRKARDGLEIRVKERTAELVSANEQLQREIEERRRTEKELRKSEARLRQLSSRLLEVQENERKRIGMELHDSIAQSLVSLKIGLERKLMGMDIKKAPTGIMLESLLAMVQQSAEEIRRIIKELRPSILDELGILETINWLCQETQQLYPDMRIQKHLDIQENEIPDKLKIVIFRIIQEAVSNILKHSETDFFRISLARSNRTLELSIMDNGVGFNIDELHSGGNGMNGLGLSSMRERACFYKGYFAIDSRPGKGTTVKASWPL